MLNIIDLETQFQKKLIKAKNFLYEIEEDKKKKPFHLFLDEGEGKL